MFDNLGRLEDGDRIRLVTEKGMLHYVVHAELTYRTQAMANHAPQLFSQSSPGRLILVTCSGWNGEAYLTNHVIIAKTGP